MLRLSFGPFNSIKPLTGLTVVSKRKLGATALRDQARVRKTLNSHKNFGRKGFSEVRNGDSKRIFKDT
jgi:hypothetical protein